jgi:hypothetical protein
MKIKISVFLAAAVFLASCEIPGAVLSTPSLPPAAAPQTQAADAVGCISSEPAQDDIDRALKYTDEIFSGAEWARSYTVETNRVTVTFSGEPLNALAFVEALIFQCGYSETEVDGYFNQENWDIIFVNYDSYEAVSDCRFGESLRLYQFKAMEEGYGYRINYWALNDTEWRVMGMMIVFPVESKSLMDEYSSALFPELASCK